MTKMTRAGSMMEALGGTSNFTSGSFSKSGFSSQLPKPANLHESRSEVAEAGRGADKSDYELDQDNVGTPKYKGLAYFWHHEFRHELRDLKPSQRKKVHSAWLKAKLGLSSYTQAHADILRDMLGDRYWHEVRTPEVLESVAAPKESGSELSEKLMPQLDAANRELTLLRRATAKRDVFPDFLDRDTKRVAVDDLMAFQRLFGTVQNLLQDVAMSIGKVENDTPDEDLNKQLNKISDAALDAEDGMRKLANAISDGYRDAMTDL